MIVRILRASELRDLTRSHGLQKSQHSEPSSSDRAARRSRRGRHELPRDRGRASPTGHRLRRHVPGPRTGIDIIHPDFDFLQQRAADVEAVVLTHGHEDHIGALPYLLDDVKVPVYGPPYALALVQERLREGKLNYAPALHAIYPRTPFALGPFGVDAVSRDALDPGFDRPDRARAGRDDRALRGFQDRHRPARRPDVRRGTAGRGRARRRAAVAERLDQRRSRRPRRRRAPGRRRPARADRARRGTRGRRHVRFERAPAGRGPGHRARVRPARAVPGTRLAHARAHRRQPGHPAVRAPSCWSMNAKRQRCHRGSCWSSPPARKVKPAPRCAGWPAARTRRSTSIRATKSYSPRA